MFKKLWEAIKEFFASINKKPEAIPAPVPKPDPKPLPHGSEIIDVTDEYPTLVALWKKHNVRPENYTVCKWAADNVLKYKSRYKTVEAKTGVPWYVIGCIHKMESDQNWLGVLHNGEKIVGTDKKTTLVPAGRGPFATWEDAAIDALKVGEWNPAKWSLGEILEFLERYNGLGYRKRGINSPYVWGYTTAYLKGRYVADGKFDPESVQKRPGCAAILKCLEEMKELKIG